jgi:hypothetical protein
VNLQGDGFIMPNNFFTVQKFEKKHEQQDAAKTFRTHVD